MLLGGGDGCWAGLGPTPTPTSGANSESGAASTGLKGFWGSGVLGRKTWEVRSRGWRGPGCTSLKGPDYRPELESDVWERAGSRFLQLLPLPRHLGFSGRGAGRWQSGEGRRRSGGASAGRCFSLRKLESGRDAGADGWRLVSWEGNGDPGARKQRF